MYFLNNSEVVLKSLTGVLFFALILLLAGFSATGELIPAEEYSKLLGETTNVNDVIISTETVVNYIDLGMVKASWYGPRFHGRKTASGELFDQNAFTAAHKKYRFGTLLKLTNPDNDKSVVVRINDRGPFIRNRGLDLSKAAAEELGMRDKGIAKLKMELVTLKGLNFPVIPFN